MDLSILSKMSKAYCNRHKFDHNPMFYQPARLSNNLYEPEQCQYQHFKDDQSDVLHLPHLSVQCLLFFHPFPVSLPSLFCLCPLFFSYGTYKGKMNSSSFFSHACFLPLLSFLALCFTRLLSLFLREQHRTSSPSPPALLSASSSPLGFSPVEGLSSEGNNSVFDS